ncbi:MAG: protein BatD [SAR324 cluster bacterium]|nr:protein BatD [SAR324 cluster bacterium]
MMKKFWFLEGNILLLWCIFIVPAHALQFFASVDKKTGTIEDYFVLTLTVQDVSSASQPQLSSSPDFKINYQGQSSQTQWINGKVSAQIDFRYALIPLRTGTLQIPLATVEVEGQNYKSNPIQIEITKAANVPAAQKTAFVKSFLSADKAYPNQQIIYTFELYIKRGLKVTNLRFERPELSAFHVNELEKAEPVIRVMGGQSFEVYTVTLGLTPLKEGTIEIGSASLHGEQLIQGRRNSLFDNFGSSFFSGQRKPFQLRTEPLVLESLPFPEKKQPADFYGLVGNYAIQAKLSQEKVKVGESTTLTLTVTGTGRAESIRKPSLQLDSTLKVYEDQPSYDTQIQGPKQLGRAVFTMAIVPSQPKKYNFHPVTITFFDPENKSYETRQVAIPPLFVEAGEAQQLTAVGGDSLLVQKHAVQRLGDDLLPLHKDMAALENMAWTYSSILLYSAFFFLGPLFFCFGLFWKWRAEHSATNVDKIRSSQALSKFKKELKRIQSEVTEAQPVAQSIMIALKKYIGDKANKYGEALTAQEIESWLQEKQVEADLISKLKDLFEHCELAQYAASSFSGENKQQIYELSQNVISQIEGQLK